MNSSQTAAADRLWQRFGEMFGARFFESFGPKPSESWTDAVTELRQDQVRVALSRIRNSGSPHPPSLPEFLALARNVQQQPQKQASSAPMHPLQGAANSALFTLLRDRGPASEECIAKLIETKNQIVRDLPTDTDPAEVRDVLLRAFEKHWVDMPESQRLAVLDRFAAARGMSPQNSAPAIFRSHHAHAGGASETPAICCATTRAGELP